MRPRTFVEQVAEGLSDESIVDISAIEPDLKRELRRAGAGDEAIDMLITTGRAKLDRHGHAEVLGERAWVPAGAALHEAIDFATRQTIAESQATLDTASDAEVAQIAPYRLHRVP